MVMGFQGTYIYIYRLCVCVTSQRGVDMNCSHRWLHRSSKRQGTRGGLPRYECMRRAHTEGVLSKSCSHGKCHLFSLLVVRSGPKVERCLSIRWLLSM